MEIAVADGVDAYEEINPEARDVDLDTTWIYHPLQQCRRGIFFFFFFSPLQHSGKPKVEGCQNTTHTSKSGSNGLWIAENCNLQISTCTPSVGESKDVLFSSHLADCLGGGNECRSLPEVVTDDGVDASWMAKSRVAL